MLVEYTIEDGYHINGRVFTAEVDDEDLADCETLEGARQTIATYVQEAFEERIGWSSEALDPDQARKLWEAAKAAQGGQHAGK